MSSSKCDGHSFSDRNTSSYALLSELKTHLTQTTREIKSGIVKVDSHYQELNNAGHYEDKIIGATDSFCFNVG